MKIKLIGNRENPAIVLIHGIFCNYESVMHFAEYLQNDYFLILPTLDGHYPDSKDFTTAAKQARILTVAIEKTGIERIAMIHGTSVGAVVALEMAKICPLPVDSYFFDSGLFFSLNAASKKIKYNKFIKFTDTSKGISADEFMHEKTVRKYCGDNPESYGYIIDSVINTIGFITENTVANIADACYSCHLPNFDDEVTRKFMFNFSDGEPAHKCRKRLEKKYPLARFSGYSGSNYCGFQVNEPERYAHFLRGIIENAK